MQYEPNIFEGSFFGGNFIYFLPELFLCLILIFFIVFGVIFKQYYSQITTFFFINFSLLTFFFLFCLLLNFNVGGFVFNYLFVFDEWSFMSKLILTSYYFFFFFLLLKYALDYKFIEFEPIIIFNLIFMSMLCLISVNDFLALYMCLELQSLGLYILASLKRYSFYSTEAGIKYFVLGSIASCFLLLGISLVYGFLGTTNFVDLIFFKDIYIYQEYFFILQIGFFFICFAFIFKLGGFPFHFWVPDIYVGVPSVITAFFSILPKFVLISIFFRVCGLLSSIYLSWLSIFIITGLFSIGFGVLGAFFQVSLKRLMAFGAVNHIGFIFVSLSLNSIEGFSSSFFYILVYMFLSLGFFFCFLHMRFFESNTLIKSIYELNSVYVVYPVFGSMFSLLFFSFAGIPPLVGFFSKFYILLGLVNEMAIFLSFFIILFSLISAFYYIRLIKISFFEKAFFYPFFKPIEKNSAYILAFITSLNTFFLVFLGPFFIFCQNVILLWLL